MRTIETTVFKFNELSDCAKEKARRWYRDGNTCDEFFSESVYEDAAEIAELMGLDIRQRRVNTVGGGHRYKPAIYWSGFWNQGDGACCEGEWRAHKVKPGGVADYAPQDKELHRIAAELERLALLLPNASFTVKHRGHYHHENCTVFDFSGTVPEDDDGHALELSPEEQSKVDAAEDDLAEAARDFMRWIYRQLEKEYEWVNSDEVVDEILIANEYEFAEDGEIA